MGQSIQHITLSSIGNSSIETMAKNVNDFVLYNDFKLGKGYCQFEQTDNEIIFEIIHSNYCEVVELLEDSIEGRAPIYAPNMPIGYTEAENYNSNTWRDNPSPENGWDGIDPDAKSALYGLWVSRGNTGTMDDFLDILLTDEKMNWYETNW